MCNCNGIAGGGTTSGVTQMPPSIMTASAGGLTPPTSSTGVMGAYGTGASTLNAGQAVQTVATTAGSGPFTTQAPELTAALQGLQQVVTQLTQLVGVLSQLMQTMAAKGGGAGAGTGQAPPTAPQSPPNKDGNKPEGDKAGGGDKTPPKSPEEQKKLEEFGKKWESMTPEQKQKFEEFCKAISTPEGKANWEKFMAAAEAAKNQPPQAPPQEPPQAPPAPPPSNNGGGGNAAPPKNESKPAPAPPATTNGSGGNAAPTTPAKPQPFGRRDIGKVGDATIKVNDGAPKIQVSWDTSGSITASGQQFVDRIANGDKTIVMEVTDRRLPDGKPHKVAVLVKLTFKDSVLVGANYATM